MTPDADSLMPKNAQAAALRTFAAALRGRSEDLVQRWLERIAHRITLDPALVFPSEDLLDHIPMLVERMGDYVADHSNELAADTPVVSKARELGRMRHEQGFDARQILWEYEILGAVLFQALGAHAEEHVDSAPHLTEAADRLFHAVAVVQRETMTEFLDHAERVIGEREDRLRSFNRALSHEVRNEIGAILGAAHMLSEEFVVAVPEERERFVRMIAENAERMRRLVDDLIELSRTDRDTRSHRNVHLRHAIEESVRRLREMASAAGVQVRVAGELPEVEVKASLIELVITNLLSNAIKYHDPSREDRWVEIRVAAAGSSPAGRSITVEVADNGRGVPPAQRERIFERFFRGDRVGTAEGSGLGLSLVRDALTTAGGRVWAEFPDSGETVFAFTIPARRAADGLHPDADGQGPQA